MRRLTHLRALLPVAVCLTVLPPTGGAAQAGQVPLAGAPDQAAADVLHVARNQLGDGYAWAGNGPDTWDCSGLTSLWVSVGGVRGMPRTSVAQQAWAVGLPEEQRQVGDLVFFGHPVTHVGLYAGSGQMVDASESRAYVVQRAVWSSGVVRYGRVPRPGMTPVRPWTPPPLPPPTPPSPSPSPSPTSGSPAPSPRPTPSDDPSPPAAPSATPERGLVPLAGLPGVQARPSSRIALRAAANARGVRGSTAWNDVSLVRVAWRHAGGGVLPAARAALVARGRTVALADARVGDLVVYGNPATHLGVYQGHGYMVDASTTLGRVVVRRVYASPGVRLVRLG